MSAHTPGPWILNGVMALDMPLWIVSIPGEQVRIEVAHYSADSEGNARLIAAAPELLETLKLVMVEADFGDEELERRCLAAIAKAEGTP